MDEVQQLVSDYDEFSKLSTRIGADTAARLFSQGGITNNQLQAAANMSPSLTNAPGANRRILGDLTEIILNGADALEIEVENRDEYEELMNTLRGNPSQTANPSAWAGMADDDFLSIDTTNLSEEEQAAYDAELTARGF